MPPVSQSAAASLPSDGQPTLDQALIDALDDVMPRYQRILKHALIAAEGDDRLSLPQLRCLQAMAETDGPSLTTKLARVLLVTPPTMTRTIDGLVERGLVARQPDPANRRQIDLALTPAGRDLLARYEGVMANHLRSLLSQLDDASKHRLLAALGDIGAVLDAGDGVSGSRS